MYQNASEKGLAHPDAADLPRRCANKRRGHGTWESDRSPILGVIGRDSGQVELTVLHHTTTAELRPVVEAATQPTVTVNTDEWRSYSWLDRTAHPHPTSTHTPGHRVWSHDADGDGVREVNSNTIEGFWVGLRNFLRPFRGVSKHYLWNYVALYAWTHNFLKTSPFLVRSMVKLLPSTPVPS